MSNTNAAKQLQAQTYRPYARGALMEGTRRVWSCRHRHLTEEAAAKCAQDALERRATTAA